MSNQPSPPSLRERVRAVLQVLREPQKHCQVCPGFEHCQACPGFRLTMPLLEEILQAEDAKLAALTRLRDDMASEIEELRAERERFQSDG